MLGFALWGLAMGNLHDLIAARGKKAALEGGVARRDVIEAAAAYLADESDALACAYSGWAQCALPHRRLPPDQPWEVASGPMALVVEPGRRRKEDGTLEWCGVPFGSHARLILLYLQTQALRRDSREVPLGDSWRDWLHRMGLSWGGNTGRSVREQAELLSRCKLTFHLGQPGRHGMINQAFIESALFVEVDEEGRQGRLALDTATLSEAYFRQLKKHPLPLEEAAIRTLANDSAALDCYLWLAYRLHSLSQPKLIPWKALKEQHGRGYRELKHFKARFPTLLGLATAVYPAARVEVRDDGVLLHPSGPPISRKIVPIGALGHTAPGR